MDCSENFLSIIGAINSTQYKSAKKMLRDAISVDMENPEAYNLLGIVYEKEGNRLKASKFYRVAYYMDQTFKPAMDNLDRVCDFLYKGGCDKKIQWGMNLQEVKK